MIKAKVSKGKRLLRSFLWLKARIVYFNSNRTEKGKFRAFAFQSVESDGTYMSGFKKIYIAKSGSLIKAITWFPVELEGTKAKT